ncbi:SNF2 domain-containing protein CLASSY 2-like [Triticum dicoccoides]|uniref:SNF2 domain-containing protein CLASSY 2-like n=1 Tax=Triticum dicoccoides TaxID=85692 RepID=UPI0018908550|nr:SNF2 domain-containing protein CLASSY 2-like [Triticum dicoccoides]
MAEDTLKGGPKGRRSHPISETPFEAFYDGSWHEVNCIRVRNGGLFVKFYSGSTVEHNVDGDHLRLRSRRATYFDCSHVLKPGVDICVQSSHPLQGNPTGEMKFSMLLCHDARLITIKRNHIEDQCLCLFVVMLRKNLCPDNTENRKVISDRKEQVVTLKNIFLLQKLQPEELHEGSIQWSCAEDCLSHNRSKLLSARFSQEIAHLIVLSILNGMEFTIKLVEGNIIYRIIKGGRASCNLDSMSTPPGFGNNMEIISFQLRNEALRPIIRNIPVTHPKKHNLTEDMRFTMKAELDGQLEDRRFTVKTELDGLLDVFSYEEVDLRRSKRRKTQAERFTSYETPNFGRDRWKRCDAPSTKHGNSQRASRRDSPVAVESTYGEVPVNITRKQTSATAFVVKENPNSAEGKHKSTARITPVKGKPSSVEVKEESTVEERSPGPHVPRTPAKSKERNLRPLLSLRRKSFTSSRSLNGNSEPAFGRKRKERMCEREYKKMINQCIGNIQSEMERDFEFNLGVPMMNYGQGFYGEVNFTWPASADNDSQEEKDGLEEFWKEMDHSLTTLALEKNQANCNGYNKERPGCRNIDHDDLVLDPSLLAILGPEFSELKGSGNLWSLIPDLEPKLLPHQRNAFEFIWKNLAGSLQLEEMDNPTASTGGCVVAHTPGSGKTLLLISFLVSYLKVHPRSRPLVLTPKSAIHTWMREFEKWGISLPLHVLHQADKRGKPMGPIDPRLQAILSNFRRPNWKNICLVDRMDKLCKWHEHPSVLLMTYSSFLRLAKEDSRMPQRAFMVQVLINNPGLLILDEGHNPRSNKSKLRRVLMKVKTEFRILMSGTVFQNNFEEYFNTLSLARPRFVDDVMTVLVPERKKETRGRRAKHREAVARRIFVDRVGQMIESSDNWDRQGGISLLNKLTCGFIDSFEGSKLRSLPGIHVYTLFMKPTEIQEDILSRISMATSCGGRYLLEVELLITIASIHPWLIKTTKSSSTYFTPEELHKVDKYKRDFVVGCKAKFLIDLLHKSSYRGERVLIFCHNVSPISFLVELIENVFGWRLGEEVLVLQGDQELPVRSDVMDKFNTDSQGKRKVLIASTTACAEGISLTGASRLVMLDSEWNHSKTRQAIARAFRPGQERTVYVYLLVASGTWEEDKYSRNRRKAWMAKMVFHGRYFDDPLRKAVTDFNDDILKELADEDKTKTFHMIVKQD